VEEITQLLRPCLAGIIIFGMTASAIAAEGGNLTIGFTVSQTGALNNDSVAQMRDFELWRDR
jgi:hypothetical protein